MKKREIRVRIYFKPPTPTGISLNTVNLRTKKPATITLEGTRQDPVIAPRAVPVVEAVMAMCLLDRAMRAGLIPSARCPICGSTVLKGEMENHLIYHRERGNLDIRPESL